MRYVILLIFFCMFMSLSLIASETATQTADVPSSKIDVQELDLSIVYGGDLIKGRSYSEEELVDLLIQYPSLVVLNIGGQPLTPAVGAAIFNMAKLENLTLHGNIWLYANGYDSESFEKVIVQQIEIDFLAALMQGGSKLKGLDLDFSNINDEGLALIGQGMPLLEEISLFGCDQITDEGLMALVAQCRGLKTIHLGAASLREGFGNTSEIPLTISPALIQQLRENGISVIIMQRHP